MSDSLRPHGLQHTRLLSAWDFPGKNTRVVVTPGDLPYPWAVIFFSRGIFLTQWSNSHLLHCQVDSYHWAIRQPSPCLVFKIYNLRQCPKWDISTSSYELICKIYVSMDICIIPRGTSVPVWDCNSIHISFVALITLLQFLAWLSILPSFSRMMQFYPLSILASSFQTKIPPLLLCYLLLYLYCLHQIFGAG